VSNSHRHLGVAKVLKCDCSVGGVSDCGRKWILSVVDTKDVSVVVPSLNIVGVIGAIGEGEGIFCVMEIQMHSSVELSCVKCVGNSVTNDNRF